MTVTIEIKKYLSEYLISKYWNQSALAVVLPCNSDLYVLISNLMSKRPSYNPVDTGNTTIRLPHRRNGKHPSIYNYLSKSAVLQIESVISEAFWLEVHNYMRRQKNKFKVDYYESACHILDMYKITGISTDGILKHFYRYRSFSQKK